MLKRFLYRNYYGAGKFGRRFGGRITMVGRVVTGATVITAALGTDTTASVAYQTFSFLLFVVVLSVAGLLWSGRRVGFERIVPKFGSVGEPLPYVAVVRNKTRRTMKSLSLIEELVDPRPTLEQFLNTVEPGEETRNWFDRTFCFYRWRWLLGRNIRLGIEELTLPEIPPGATREVRAQVMPLRRGVANLAGVIIACPEPLGLFRAFRRIPAPQSVLILPKRYRMPPFELPGTMKYQQGGVSMASSVGESEEFVSLRDYRPGDPLRRMHWKSFAKAGKPVVKEFQDEFFVRHALILDTFGEAPYSDIFEEAVSVAASVAYTLQDLMFIGPKAYCFTMGRGVSHIEQMLEVLASVQPCLDKDFSTLESLVLGHSGDMSGCLCVLLAWDEPRQQFIKMLRRRGVPLRVFVVTSDETELDPGPMADEPKSFFSLPVAKIAERLAGL